MSTSSRRLLLHGRLQAMSAIAAAAKKFAERAPRAARSFKTSTAQQSGGHGHSTGVSSSSFSCISVDEATLCHSNFDPCCHHRATMIISTLSICTVWRRYKLPVFSLRVQLFTSLLDSLLPLQMPNRKLKMALACSGIVISGVAIPVVAIQFQKAKTAG